MVEIGRFIDWGPKDSADLERHSKGVAVTVSAKRLESIDPVARLHLGNRATIERLNWCSDLSTKGMKQSYGLMDNYLYDLKRLDRARSALSRGKVAQIAELENLLQIVGGSIDTWYSFCIRSIKKQRFVASLRSRVERATQVLPGET